jgi:hypothetical protein
MIITPTATFVPVDFFRHSQLDIFMMTTVQGKSKNFPSQNREKKVSRENENKLKFKVGNNET